MFHNMLVKLAGTVVHLSFAVAVSIFIWLLQENCGNRKEYG